MFRKNNLFIILLISIGLLLLTACDSEEDTLDSSTPLEEDMGKDKEIIVEDVDYKLIDSTVEEIIKDVMKDFNNFEYLSYDSYRDDSLMNTGKPIRYYSNLFIDISANIKNIDDMDKVNDEIMEFQALADSALSEMEIHNKEKDKVYEVDVNFLKDGEPIQTARMNYMGMTRDSHLLRENRDGPKHEKEALKVAYDFSKRDKKIGHVLLNFGVDKKGDFIVRITTMEPVPKDEMNLDKYFEKMNEEFIKEVFKNKNVIKYMEELEYEDVYIDWVNTGPRADKSYEIEL